MVMMLAAISQHVTAGRVGEGCRLGLAEWMLYAALVRLLRHGLHCLQLLHCGCSR